MGAGAGQAIGGGLGIIGGGINLAQNIRQQKEAKSALENYQRQKFLNVADGQQVSTLGSDLEREEQSRLASSQVDALRGGGSRTILGGLGRVQAGNNEVMARTGANLDMQQKDIDRMRAEDEARIRGLQENREIGDINALSSQYSSATQGIQDNIANITQSASMGANAFGKQAPTDLQPQVQGVNKIDPAGIAPYNNPIQATPYPTSQFGQFGQGMFRSKNKYIAQ